MSRIPKYFRSDDFDAPSMYTDKWGYLNDVLRKCLVEGYNQRIDLNRYDIISNYLVKFTFTTAHNYRVDQVLKISNISNPELERECYITEVATNYIVCKFYTEIYNGIGTSSTSLNGISIVSPCGFREKWRSGDRSVYVIDQDNEECFLTVDARTPANWQALVGSTYPASVAPVVYMCDGMSDIDTITGSRIYPFDPIYPTRFKDEWVAGTYPRKGIAHFLSGFGVTTSNTNTAANATTVKVRWKIIGNGRFFWLITEPTNPSYADRNSIFAFGKFYNKYQNDSDYMLLPVTIGSTLMHYTYSDLTYPNFSFINCISNNTISNSNIRYTSTYNDIYMLSKSGASDYVRFNIGYAPLTENNTSSSPTMVSGSSTSKYDVFSGSYNMCDFTIYTRLTASLVGVLPSIKFLYQSLSIFHGVVYTNLNKSGDTKRLVYIRSSAPVNASASEKAHTYMFSLEYQDWKNYD